MALDHHEEFKTFWLRRAARLRRMVNLGWWWSAFALPMVLGCLAFAVLLYVFRSIAFSYNAAWLFLCVWLLVSAIFAFYRSRKLFIGTPAALSRLDVAYHFHHRLVSAHDGVGQWPPVRDVPTTGHGLPLRWRWPTAAKPVLMCLMLLVMAFKLPIAPDKLDVEVVRHEPMEWQSVELVTDTLRERELVQEEALKKIEEQIAALRRKPSEEWYRHGTMEATSHVRDQVGRDGRRLQQALEKTASLLQAAQAQKLQGANSLSASQQAQWKELLNQLGLEAMPLNGDLLGMLKEIDPSQLRQLSAADMEKIEAMLNEHSNELKQCLAAAGMEPGNAGSGGISRGPGTLPLSLNDEESRVDDAVPLAISNPDMKRAALGQMIGLADGRHDVDTERYAGPMEAGPTASPGGEGEVVWRQAVLPGEQKVLKQYFK